MIATKHWPTLLYTYMHTPHWLLQ